MKLSKIIFALVVLNIFLFSCSSMLESTRKTISGDSSPRKSSDQEVKWVSKTQYDELMAKYKNLSTKYENLKDSQLKNRSGFDQLDSVVDSTVEQVDLVDNDNTQDMPQGDIENDVQYYLKAKALVENNKQEEALKIFQFLEKSKMGQVSVRSKFNIGKIYMNKKQYDLALQVFESIIKQGSFSSVVLEALQSSKVASDALGLASKSRQYGSLLKDVFEVRG